ncbi:MAG: PrpR N-terminal domain-containing protein [Oscillospiraceae bacterium]
MGKTILMVPRREMMQLAQRLLPEFPGAVDAVRCATSTETVVEEANECIKDGADIIIARGLQAIYIEENCSVSVVNMKLNAQDVAILVHKAKKLCNVPHPKIALLGAANMFPDLSAFNELFDIDLQIYECPKSVPSGTKAKDVVKEKPDILIGGIADVEEGKKQGIPSIYIASSEDSMREAIRASILLRHAIEMRKQADALYESLFTGAFNGFILFDNNGVALRCNSAAELILSCSEKEIISQNIYTLFPKLERKKFRDAVENGTVYTEFLSIRKKTFVIILKPVVTDSITNSIVLSFRLVKSFDHWEAAQSKVRTSFSLKAESPALKHCIQTAKLFCLTSLPILIYAEPSINATYAARCIHRNSDCSKGGSFISANCSSWSGCDQQNDYLFGYGPKATNEFALGFLGLAREGTLFLDNIEALTTAVQYRLYHAVSYHALFYPSSCTSVPINFRLIARTKLSINQLAQDGGIIPELYNELAPMSFRIPPLRETSEDIPHLVEEYFNRSCNKYDRFLMLSNEAKELLTTYSWDGNLPQLKVFMERLVITAEEKVVGRDLVKTLMQYIYPISRVPGHTELVVNTSQEEMRILNALRHNDGDRMATASELGISKATLWRWMKKYEITTKY